MREEIREFADEMERVMSQHDKEKGDSWKTVSIRVLEDKLDEEYDETIVLNSHPLEFIDLANICMMLWQRLRKCALAEFEQNLIMERTRVGIERAKREGRVCNRPKKEIDVDRVIVLLNTGNVKTKEIARMFGTSTVTIWKRLKEAGVEKHYDKFERRKNGK